MDQYEEIVLKLKSRKVLFDKGLSFAEIGKIEKLYSISFPLELIRFYSYGLPVSNDFWNWRDTRTDNVEKIKEILEMPRIGLLYDLEYNDLWCEDWGKRPVDTTDAEKIMMEKYDKAPRMIPVYSHRYMPYIPDEVDIPVFSIMQSDIIYYGMNLISYLEIEFGFSRYKELGRMDFKYIDFWSALI